MLLHRHRPAGSICGYIAGGAVDLGVVDVAKPEFDLGTEVVAYARLQFRPARCGDDGVYAKRQALCSEILDVCLEVGKLADESRPPIDDQKNIAERIGRNRLAGIRA